MTLNAGLHPWHNISRFQIKFLAADKVTKKLSFKLNVVYSVLCAAHTTQYTTTSLQPVFPDPLFGDDCLEKNFLDSHPTKL